MVVTINVITILTLLLVVVLAQALHNNIATTVAARRSRALAVAEAGVSWAIAALEADPTAAVVVNRAVPVADGTGGTVEDPTRLRRRFTTTRRPSSRHSRWIFLWLTCQPPSRASW